MNRKLQLLFDSLEQERHQLLERISSISVEQFNRTESGKWSVNQILAHLIAAEVISVRYMNKKILGITESGNTGWLEEMKMILLKASQRLPFKFKAPRAVLENTPAYNSFNELRTDWDRKRAELKELLESFDDSQIKKQIYKHIRAGRLNVQHALIFFREHQLHHWPQIKRLLK